MVTDNCMSLLTAARAKAIGTSEVHAVNAESVLPPSPKVTLPVALACMLPLPSDTTPVVGVVMVTADCHLLPELEINLIDEPAPVDADIIYEMIEDILFAADITA